jgi:tRNA threonylcarbamoyl adenosine modification protein YjeE
MPVTGSESASFSVVLPDEEATRRLVADLASVLQPGDFVALAGDLGAGKTTFARALIRCLADDEAIEVPSPTFTILQIYDLPHFPLVHIDLYRTSGPDELAELGFDDLPENAVVLLEWPDRAGKALPPDRFEVTLTLAPKLKQEFRLARVSGLGACARRVERMAAARAFIAECGFGDAPRRPMPRDASIRSYQRLVFGGRNLLLMDWLPRPDGPPVRDGKPYSALAHIADNVTPFVALAKGLRERGLMSPDIYHADLAQGFLIIEDLGDERVVAGQHPPLPIEERYETAVDALLMLHEQSLPDVLPVAPHLEYRLPSYDLEAFLIEAELLLDWYLPRFNVAITDEMRAAFRALWSELLQPAVDMRPTWVLRDFHSPNLLWRPEQRGLARLGILDFQDAVMGPPAYDLASLLQDARVDVAEATELSLLGRYMRPRLSADAEFDSASFIKLYVTLAAQRASKILGIFARLDRRDGKPQYLRHMPRIWGYLQRSLAHPSLASLNAWYQEHVPAPETS